MVGRVMTIVQHREADDKALGDRVVIRSFAGASASSREPDLLLPSRDLRRCASRAPRGG
jgi:hypothetical protein